MPLGIGLGHDGQVLPGPRSSDIEGEAHDALDAAAGEDGGLGGDFLRQAAVGASALTGIFAFGVLPHDHPVQVAGATSLNGEVTPGRTRVGPDVGILVQALADLQPQAP